MTLRTLFPTQLYEAQITNKNLISGLEASIWMLEEGDAAGRHWCNEKGYEGYTSYASLDDLPARTPDFAELKTLLDTHANRFAQALGWELSGARLTLDSLWVNILGPGGSHSGHIHPTSILSGTAYIAMPQGAGALKLEDPRLPYMMAAPPPRTDAPLNMQRFIYLDPKPGDILIWESWLRHEVGPNRSDQPRLSISFNYGLH